MDPTSPARVIGAAWTEARVREFCSTYAGPKVIPFAESVPLRYDLTEVRKAVPRILQAQRVILKHLLSRMAPAEVLGLLGVPAELAPWIPIFADPDGAELPTLRVDLIPSPDGSAWMCELNVDSSIGGAETAQFRRFEEISTGGVIHSTPFEDLSALLARIMRDRGLTEICLLDWSYWDDYGSYNFEWMIKSLEYCLPAGTRVFYATEKVDLDLIGGQTLVYRCFMSEDALLDLDFVAAVFDRAGHVLGDFSGEVMGSKVWMALLHDAEYRALLDKPLLEAVDRTIPETCLVSEANVDEVLAEKEAFFFKTATDFGGAGTMDGGEVDRADIREKIVYGEKRWVAQRLVPPAEFDVRLVGESEARSRESILGLYLYGGRWSGVLVRSRSDSTVINLAKGAAIGWGYEVSADEG
ncbi:harpin HrpZ family protein [Streptomyces sp. N2-109]|uniref:Harpin HrpZ family protein n=1 Tax=Streptomyces gossypii TaxID=2883101 RepID=A0ABT2JP30_9ACTN|nr:harpin HrpZ family protein [Streptomyces gossypii]MCT2589642.1 harpin HrpZ family protein [Streptomyces gossypii]